MKTQIEIEKKLVIKKPSVEWMASMPEYSVSEIEQIYLRSAPTLTHRIRARSFGDKTVYTETVKLRLGKMSASETEGEIGAERYSELSKNIADGSHPIKKTRHTFTFEGHTLEIDIYHEWENACILEVELSSLEESFSLPECISIIKDVTGEKRYSNASMSRSFPEEPPCHHL